MTVREGIHKALSLFADFGVEDYTVEIWSFDNFSAVTKLKEKQVLISSAVLEASEERFMRTVAHELAHILTADEPEHHGERWKRTFESLPRKASRTDRYFKIDVEEEEGG